MLLILPEHLDAKKKLILSYQFMGQRGGPLVRMAKCLPRASLSHIIAIVGVLVARLGQFRPTFYADNLFRSRERGAPSFVAATISTSHKTATWRE